MTLECNGGCFSMKNFDDIRKELKEEDEALFHTLELVGNIMAIREEKGISQRQLSTLSGVAQKTISRIESGIDVPNFTTLIKLANGLGYTLDVKLEPKDDKKGG